MNGLVKIANQRGVRAIAGRVDVSGGTPSAAKGEGYTVSDTGAGQVTVTLSKPGRSFLCVLANAYQTTDATFHGVKVDAVSEGASVVFNVYVADATDGALVDNVGFYFLILVKDVA